MTEKTMRAARMYHVGEPMIIEDVPMPIPGASDVRVKVKACNIVPNLGNILANWTTWFPQNPLPALPAIFGLDASGVVDAVGPDVANVQVGDRVYVNPGRFCGGCLPCRHGQHINCDFYALAGYFGMTPKATRTLDRYPYGGLAEYTLAPEYSLVSLPDNVTFEQGARFGYLGTAYAALRKLEVGPNTTVLISGISGTLGLGVALYALALGAPRILGTGRDRELLKRVEKIASDRIETHSLLDGPVDEWVWRVSAGADVLVDAVGPGAPHEGLIQGIASLRRGGRAVNVGAIAGMVPTDVHHMMDQQIRFEGSAWFTAGQGQDMAALSERGLVDLSILENVITPLEDVNAAISGIAARNGGFSNFIISPEVASGSVS